MALLGLVIAEAPSFAQTFQRGWIDVNFGAAVGAEDTFRMRGTGTLFREEATFDSDYNLPRGASFDFGGGVMLTPMIGIGVSVTGTAHEDVADLSIRIPHPTQFNAHATATAPTDEKLMRTEGGIHLQAMFVPLETGRLRVRVFGGPSYFRVTQDVVTDIRFDQVFLIFSPVNAVTITEFDAREIESNGWGFHAGGDLSVFFNRIIGVGGFARFSRGNVDLENPIAISSSDDDFIEVKTGGFQMGGGLRLKF
jgi:hypothetical protein